MRKLLRATVILPALILSLVIGVSVRAENFESGPVLKSEVPPPLISLLRSLGRLKLGFEMANVTDGHTIDDGQILRRISAQFELSESVIIELIDRKAKLDRVERSLVPVIRVGERGLNVKLNGVLNRQGEIQASLDFADHGQAARLPVIVKNKRLGEFLLSIKSLGWKAQGLDPTQNLLSQYIDLKIDCQIATHRSSSAGEWSEIPCSGTIEYDPSDKKWYFQIHLTPHKLENIVSPEGMSCPQDSEAIARWMSAVMKSYQDRHEAIPNIIDHPLGGDIFAQSEFGSDPYKEYFSNFLVRVDQDEIYLGPQNFGLVLKIPRNSWIFVCGDTRLSNSAPFIDISFFKIKSSLWNSNKKTIKSGPIGVRWRPISGAADSMGGFTRDVPLIRDFFKIIRDVSAPIQDLIGGLDVDKIRLNQDGFKFTSRGKILKVISFGNDKSIDTKAFEQYLIPNGSTTDAPAKAD